MDYVAPFAVEDGEVVVRADVVGRELPFAFELSAYDADGYVSQAIQVEVTDEESDVGGDGCAVGRSGAGVWALALGLLATRRLRMRRPKQGS